MAVKESPEQKEVWWKKELREFISSCLYSYGRGYQALV
jgi:hypothetical protein